MTERQLEQKLTQWARSQGGVALKGATNFDTGYPDRVVFLPGANAHVELKGTSSRYLLTEKQKVWAGRIIASKAPYYIIESESQLQRFTEEIYHNPSAYLVNTYMLNGFQLVLHINETTKTYEVISYKGGRERRILTAPFEESVPITIYRALTSLEEMYPNTYYKDM